MTTNDIPEENQAAHSGYRYCSNKTKLIVGLAVVVVIVIAVSVGVAASNKNNDNNNAAQEGSPDQTTIPPVSGKPVNTWNQFGQTVDGESEGDWFGFALAMSEDGNILAVGSLLNDANATVPNSGKVRVLQAVKDNNGVDYVWIPLGQELQGEDANHRFGAHLSLSSDGQTLAISSPRANNSTGIVHVYSLNGTEWQMTGRFEGDNEDDIFGSSVALARDGRTLAIGADQFNTTGGYARVFEFSNDGWSKVGNDITKQGGDALDEFGQSIAVSDDGTLVVVGAPGSDEPNNAGHVYTFSRSSGNEWLPLGTVLMGKNANDRFGVSLSMSSNNCLAVGADQGPPGGFGTGFVSVYCFSDGEWSQFGNTILGQDNGDEFGVSVSISSAGSAVAVGAPDNEVNGLTVGNVQVFRYDNDDMDWFPASQEIHGTHEDDSFGSAVALSGDGRTVASGSPFQDNVDMDAGHVRVYRFSLFN